MGTAKTGSRRQTKAVLLLLIGAVTSSFIAPVSRISSEVPPSLLLCLASLVALIGHFAYFRSSIPWRGIRKRKGVLFAFLGGAVLTWSYVIFAWSIRASANEFVPTVIFELYPFGIILFSNFLLNRESIPRSKLGWLALSLIGVGLVTSSVGNGSDINAWSWQLESPLVGAMIAVVFLSFGMTCVSRSTREIGKHPDAPILASLIARMGGVIATLPAIFFIDFATVPVNMETLVYVLFYGIVILTISNFAYYKAIFIARTHLINVVWYITPVLSILWLSLLGYGQLTNLVGIGAACIIVANLMLNFSVTRRLSYRITMIWILIIGTILAFVPGGEIQFEYFEAIAAPLVFFALLYGFAFQRLHSSIVRERQLVLEIMRREDYSTLNDKDTISFKKTILELARSDNAKHIFKLYSNLMRKKLKEVNLSKVEELMISKTQRLAIGELFVLFLTGGLIVFLSIYARPAGYLYDSFALIVSVAVAFTFFTLVDAFERRRRVVFHFVEKPEKSKDSHRFIVSDKLLIDEPPVEKYLVVSLSVALILVFHVIYFVN